AAGVAGGLLARPHPLGALKLAYIQVVQIITVKAQNIPLTFGRELKPHTLDLFLRNAAPALLIMITAFVLYKISRRGAHDSESRNLKNVFFASLVVSTIFLFVSA
ncbi:MAG: hypothetical protein AAB642_00435, partial [Patescibacteria group bacterium]